MDELLTSLVVRRSRFGSVRSALASVTSAWVDLVKRNADTSNLHVVSRVDDVSVVTATGQKAERLRQWLETDPPDDSEPQTAG